MAGLFRAGLIQVIGTKAQWYGLSETGQIGLTSDTGEIVAATGQKSDETSLITSVALQKTTDASGSSAMIDNEFGAVTVRTADGSEGTKFTASVGGGFDIDTRDGNETIGGFRVTMHRTGPAGSRGFVVYEYGSGGDLTGSVRLTSKLIRLSSSSGRVYADSNGLSISDDGAGGIQYMQLNHTGEDSTMLSPETGESFGFKRDRTTGQEEINYGLCYSEDARVNRDNPLTLATLQDIETVVSAKTAVVGTAAEFIAAINSGKSVIYATKAIIFESDASFNIVGFVRIYGPNFVREGTYTLVVAQGVTLTIVPVEVPVGVPSRLIIDGDVAVLGVLSAKGLGCRRMTVSGSVTEYIIAENITISNPSASVSNWAIKPFDSVYDYPAIIATYPIKKSGTVRNLSYSYTPGTGNKPIIGGGAVQQGILFDTNPMPDIAGWSFLSAGTFLIYTVFENPFKVYATPFTSPPDFSASTPLFVVNRDSSGNELASLRFHLPYTMSSEQQEYHRYVVGVKKRNGIVPTFSGSDISFTAGNLMFGGQCIASPARAAADIIPVYSYSGTDGNGEPAVHRVINGVDNAYPLGRKWKVGANGRPVISKFTAGVAAEVEIPNNNFCFIHVMGGWSAIEGAPLITIATGQEYYGSAAFAAAGLDLEVELLKSNSITRATVHLYSILIDHLGVPTTIPGIGMFKDWSR